MAELVADWILTAHARFEMARRGIAESLVRRILAAPEQRETVRPGRDIFQSRVKMEGKRYLVRVIVDVDRNPAEVVTVYRTSKVNKYWRHDESDL